MSKVAVLDIKGKEKEQIDLSDIFEGRVNADVVHQAVVMYQASLRQGNASTKERAFVSGGGKKPFRQKGTGRARAGSSRSPLWHKGGIVFGPHPRDFGYTLPKKIKKAALVESLKVKVNENKFCCIDDLTDALSKTKEFVEILKNLKLSGRILAILDGCDESITRVSRNIPRLSLMRSQDINAYDILKNKNILVTKTALQNLRDRIKK
ncbi:MAG: 50S ribosomal protein L4 [Omnitrophica WOR_2 bacterium GWF2_38_59]|nr:MAG: 50S ribosomal protein L4 [Omnitrophica WOR_2 bacterium GWA2_37_7]OGX25240.1 MAG: 50S ribosomal protein L4 [Omnitrophica WOR_2 bacterium GWF2_38_59]OGX47912.1 MAG: 50S ribosomal protein L4 [Omnitrophica WOR_2 bacterium RIFOXYA2_FULL_38_17]OGX54166.1 MAG: 50S ribosomal protein L4 [Omnitrophica WOR_2 bacterium RIFOXYA12_FULL_38_10]OGX56249.1 MAG: 50S ribosomal protein L4 [Omnitrophica WOR_2 bacterium RIFOXYC2_FULL_38_12]OGX60246.1 MAG: 50S ribosomal protein L4 [Omnitrophica WOR_2 bacteriu